MCLIERNTNENYRENSNFSSGAASNNKRALSSNHLMSDLDEEVPVQELHAMTVKTPITMPRPNWNPSTKLKFQCPMVNHDHKVRKCKEFFDMSPRERWEKLEKIRMCYSCLKPKTVCKGKKCTNVSSVLEVWNCAVCASWAESKGLAPFSIFC